MGFDFLIFSNCCNSSNRPSGVSEQLVTPERTTQILSVAMLSDAKMRLYGPARRILFGYASGHRVRIADYEATFVAHEVSSPP
jgi:hypothetical protein